MSPRQLFFIAIGFISETSAYALLTQEAWVPALPLSIVGIACLICVAVEALGAGAQEVTAGGAE